MELTTGAILRRITETPLSTSAHKLATIILDGIAWKEGYNGLERGTAAFTLANLSEKMGVSRQHLSALLAELAASRLGLMRWKPNGKFAPWLFRFGVPGQVRSDPSDASAAGDRSLSLAEGNKTIFAGKIAIGSGCNVYQTPWADLIKAAKAALPCWNVDTQLIWDRFLAFNRARGNAAVPAGFLLGFMRKWRRAPGQAPRSEMRRMVGANPPAAEREILELIQAAPIMNRHFHASDLRRAIGAAAYSARVLAVATRHSCSTFTATLAVHGQAVLAGEITR